MDDPKQNDLRDSQQTIDKFRDSNREKLFKVDKKNTKALSMKILLVPSLLAFKICLHIVVIASPIIH